MFNIIYFIRNYSRDKHIQSLVDEKIIYRVKEIYCIRKYILGLSSFFLLVNLSIQAQATVFDNS